ATLMVAAWARSTDGAASAAEAPVMAARKRRRAIRGLLTTNDRRHTESGTAASACNNHAIRTHRNDPPGQTGRAVYDLRPDHPVNSAWHAGMRESIVVESVLFIDYATTVKLLSVA